MRLNPRPFAPHRFCVLRFATWAACLAVLAFIPFIWQAGGVLTLVADFNEQQTAFNMLLNDLIKRGDYPFSWALDLGSSVPGALAFYNLGSPFFWLSALFPSAWFPYLMAPLFVLKYTVAALSAWLYLRRYTQTERMAQIGALLYAFSSFQAINLMFNHFHDVVAFFPLWLLAADELAENRRGFFLILTALCATLNFFFFVGQVVFLLLYFVLRHWLPRGFQAGLRLIPRFMLEGCLGVGLAAWLLVPALAWTLTNPRTGYTLQGQEAFLYEPVRYWVLLKAWFLPADYMAAETTTALSDYASVALWLPLVGCYWATVFLFQKSLLPWLRRLLFVLGGFALVPLLNSAFVAFNATYYTRWFYMLTLLLALASCLVWEQAGQLKRLGWATLFHGLLGLGVVSGFLLVSHPHATVGQLRRPGAFAGLFFFGLIAWLISVFILRTRQLAERAAGSDRLTRLLAGLISVACVLLQGLQVYENQTISARTKPQNAHFQTVERGLALKKFLVNHPQGLAGYRFFDHEERTNVTLVANVPTISSFLSTVHGQVNLFYDAVDQGRFVISRNRDRELQQFLGVKWVVSSMPLEKDHLLYKETLKGGTLYLYERSDALPLAFCYDAYLTERQFDALDHPTKLQSLLRALPAPEPAAQDQHPNWLMQRLKPIALRALYERSTEASRRAYQARANEAGYDFELSGNRLAFRVKAASPRVVLITIPWDTGWTCQVNGVTVEPQPVNGLMVLPVEAGENQVELTYRVVGGREGRWISGLAVLACLGYAAPLIWARRKRR